MVDLAHGRSRSFRPGSHEAAPALTATCSPSSGDTVGRILQAAHASFSTVGFGATKMEVVAQGAQVSRQTLYGYFHSKEALYEAVLVREAGILDAKLAQIDPASDPVDGLRQLIFVLFDEFVGGADFSIIDVKLHKGIRVPRRAVAVGSAHRAIIDRLLARGVEQGVFSQAAEGALFQATTIALLNGFATTRDVLQPLTGAPAASAADLDRWKAHLADVLIGSIRS